MSDLRELNMAKITANTADIDQSSQEEDISRTETGQTQEATLELNTQRQITRLEKALEIAKSESVKEKLKEEIEQAKERKAEEDKRKREELETIQTAKSSAQIAGNVYSGIAGTASNIAEKTQQLATDTTSTLATVSTPGSIFLPLTLLLLFFFLILPVNGMTRAQWLWLAITGNATIQAEKSGVKPSGGSGDIEQQNPPPTSNGLYRVSNSFTNQYIRRKHE